MMKKLIVLLLLAWTSNSMAEELLENRIDFGSERILGQSNDLGVVYLKQRKQVELESLLRVRKDYRQEILSGFSYLALDAESRLWLAPLSENEEITLPYVLWLLKLEAELQ